MKTFPRRKPWHLLADCGFGGTHEQKLGMTSKETGASIAEVTHGRFNQSSSELI